MNTLKEGEEITPHRLTRNRIVDFQSTDTDSISVEVTIKDFVDKFYEEHGELMSKLSWE